MNVQNIPLTNLALGFLPALVMVAVLFAWSMNGGRALYGMLRMLTQLLLIGYVLTYIFEADHAWIVLTVLLVMVLASSWIALGNLNADRSSLFVCSLGAIIIAGGLTLALISVGVLRLDPWYEARFLIPLAGMIFANSMNSVSLTAERLGAEIRRGDDWLTARNTALGAGMIPMVNSLFAVGLVSLPGMMTGQILSGVSPLIAVRYQIMVMCMIFGAGGLAAVLFLGFSRRIFESRISIQ